MKSYVTRANGGWIVWIHDCGGRGKASKWFNTQAEAIQYQMTL